MKSHTDLLNTLIDALYAAPPSPEIHRYQILAAEIRGQMNPDGVTNFAIYYTREANEWIKQVSGNVTVPDFAKWLKAKYPNSDVNLPSLNNPIRKLVSAGKLKLTSTGGGRRPSVYTVVGDDGWIENTGTPPMGHLVRVKYRDGHVTLAGDKQNYRWSFSGDRDMAKRDITHYQIR
jgi:hypothetical protein